MKNPTTINLKSLTFHIEIEINQAIGDEYFM